jgi:hypothetical protein
VGSRAGSNDLDLIPDIVQFVASTLPRLPITTKTAIKRRIFQDIENIKKNVTAELKVVLLILAVTFSCNS